MRVSELGRVYKAQRLAHRAIFLFPLHQLECPLQRLPHQVALLPACLLLSFARFPRQAIVQPRPGDVGESLDARRCRLFRALLGAEQMLADLRFWDASQAQLEVGKVTLQITQQGSITWHHWPM